MEQEIADTSAFIAHLKTVVLSPSSFNHLKKLAGSNIVRQRILFHYIRTLPISISVKLKYTTQLQQLDAGSLALLMPRPLTKTAAAIQLGATDICDCLEHMQREDLITNVQLLAKLVEEQPAISLTSLAVEVLCMHGFIELVVRLGTRAYNPLDPDILLDLCLYTNLKTATNINIPYIDQLRYITAVKTIGTKPKCVWEHYRSNKLEAMLLLMHTIIPDYIDTTWLLCESIVSLGWYIPILLRYKYDKDRLYSMLEERIVEDLNRIEGNNTLLEAAFLCAQYIARIRHNMEKYDSALPNISKLLETQEARC